MAISVGGAIPSASLTAVTQDGDETISSADFFGGKTVVMFAVPGAFTPTCNDRHLPAFKAALAQLKEKGVDTVACLSVNDKFVMRAWAKALDVKGITMLADGSAEFTKALGLDFDGSAFGMGIRSKRYAMLAADGVVKVLNIEEAGGFEVSGPDKILEALG